MQTILVTGGAGYIGSQTVKHLLLQGYRCIVLDNLVYGHREAVLSPDFVQVDLGDPLALAQVFQQYPIDAVIHFAAFAYVGESVLDPQKYYLNNVVNTLNLLQAMLTANVKKLVFSSTCATYGDPQYTPIDEQHPQQPVNPYGRTKLIAEQIFRDYQQAYGLQFFSLRYFNAAGADSEGELGGSFNPENHIIPIVLQAIQGKRDHIQVFGTDYDTPDGTCIRDYIHVEDLALAHRLALEKLFHDTESHYLNLGTGVGTSVLEIIRASEEVTGLKTPVIYGSRRPGDPSKLYADSSKAKQILNWQPKYTNILDIISTAWQWEQHRRY